MVSILEKCQLWDVEGGDFDKRRERQTRQMLHDERKRSFWSWDHNSDTHFVWMSSPKTHNVKIEGQVCWTYMAEAKDNKDNQTLLTCDNWVHDQRVFKR